MLFDVMDFKMETPEPPAYGLIDIGPNAVVVHTEDFGLSDLDGIRQRASSEI